MSFIDTNKHVVTLFLEQVQATPDALALEDEHNAYTYAELKEAVDSLARRLLSHGIGRENLVGILLPHTADFIIACLASLRAGGAYLILELAYPPKLLSDVIQDAGPPVLITYRSEVKNLDPNIQLIVLDVEQTSYNGNEFEKYLLPSWADYDRNTMAFVSYSSGTTGKPKGIVNHDRPGVLSYNQRFAISDQRPGDRIACNTFFIWEMFRPLIRGATAFAVPDAISYDPVGLVELLASKRITETLMTPTLLASILAQFPDAGSHLPDLRVLWITGEVVTTDLARRALQSLPKVRILNSYSTSETWDTSIGDMRDVLRDAEQSTYCSVGPPLGVNQIYILDENGNRLGPGIVGEIFIGGPVLGLGYLNLPDITAKTFVPDPFSSEPGARMYRSGDLGRILSSGALEIIGRIRAMIKLRGYSIVPGKVQLAIMTHLAVRNCAVVPYGEGLERQLVAYFVRDREEHREDRPWVEIDGSCFSPSARHILSQHLAAYMIPAYWVELPYLPADPVSGKIDNKRLPPPIIADSKRPSVEVLENNDSDEINIDTIAQIWASTLKIPRCTVTSKHNFFDLGGHSLSLATLSTRLADRFGFRVPVARLVHPSTLDGHLSTILTVRNGSHALPQADLQALLRTDCVLEKEIRPPARPKACSLKDANNVLLTGATGFLGGFLLHSLLNTTSATVTCLVRLNNGTEGPKSIERAMERIQNSLVEKGLWSPSFTGRIEVVVGDLSKRHFGLMSDIFVSLANGVQAVVHAGAVVNLVYSYAALREPNVEGMREVLRFASLNGISVYHISTNSVLPSSPLSESGWSEDTIINMEDVTTKIPDGYGQTKWAAEQLIIEARRRGLPARILRIGTIGGDSIAGFTNDQDLLTALITESIELGYAPDIGGWRVELTPANFACEVIMRLCNVEAAGCVFHLGDPNPISANVLFECLERLGYPTRPLEWNAWMALWTEKRGSVDADKSSPVGVLRSSMPTVEFFNNFAVLGNSATVPYHEDIARPPIDCSLLKTYTRHWFTRGWISKAPSSSNTSIGGLTQSVNMGRLSGRVAVVTGASSGIGAATAVALAKEGAHVALAARRADALVSLKSRLEPHGVKVLAHATDVTNGDEVDALIRATTEQLGPIDILVACAGVMYFTLMKNVRKEEWVRTVDVNCKGLLHCLSATVPDMLSRGTGHIVAISSDAGRKVFPGLGVYSGSKFFVEATLQSLRLETVGSGLRVTSIQPGNVATDLIALSKDEEAIKKYGEPSGAKVLDAENVADAIVYALKQPEHVAVNEILIEPRDEPI